MKNNKKKKVLTLSLALAAMLPATTVSAQGMLNVLDEYYAEQDAANQGGMLINTTRDSDPTPISTGITHDDFGTPVGSGLAILLLAGAGYAVIKKKED